MRRLVALSLTVLGVALVAANLSNSRAADSGKSPDADGPRDMFDAMQDNSIDAKFIARDSHRGRIVLTNKTKEPLNIEIPDAFIGVPQPLAQFGGGGGGGFGGGGGGGMGGQQQVGGGGGGGGGRRGGGGFGGGGGGRRGGGFSIQPDQVVRVDVPLLCLDHGLREPSSSKPYNIRPIENYIKDPATIAIVRAYANGDLPVGAAQAAVWNTNSNVSWEELAAKLTGTVRSAVRDSYFSREEIQTAMAIVDEARAQTAGHEVKSRDFKMPGERSQADAATEDFVSPGEETKPAAEKAAEPKSDADDEEKPKTAEPATEAAGV